MTRPNGIAPLSSGGQGSGRKGGRVVQAWQHVWDRLDRTEFRDATPLASDAAVEYGVKYESVMDQIRRMTRSGELESELRPASTTAVRRGRAIDVHRNRKFIRIASR